MQLLGQGKEMIEYVADRLGHDLRYAIDSSKAQRELGFRPEIDFITGLKQTISWYQQHRTWWEKFKS